MPPRVALTVRGRSGRPGASVPDSLCTARGFEGTGATAIWAGSCLVRLIFCRDRLAALPGVAGLALPVAGCRTPADVSSSSISISGSKMAGTSIGGALGGLSRLCCTSRLPSLLIPAAEIFDDISPSLSRYATVFDPRSASPPCRLGSAPVDLSHSILPAVSPRLVLVLCKQPVVLNPCQPVLVSVQPCNGLCEYVSLYLKLGNLWYDVRFCLGSAGRAPGKFFYRHCRCKTCK